MVARRLTHKPHHNPLAAAAIPWLIVSLWVPSTAAVTYLVTNTADSGSGSLRWAIQQANLTAGVADDIAFNIPTSDPNYVPGPPAYWRIAPASALPAITDVVTIDALTQGGPGYTGPPLVELDGTGTLLDGFTIQERACTVRGFSITGFGYYAVWIDGWTGNAHHCLVEGNYIGVDPTGTTVNDNGYGVNVDFSPSNTIGGLTPAQRNVITGNSYGIYLNGAGSTGNAIQGNFIGPDATGAAVPSWGTSQGNTFANIRAWNASNNTIGGGAPGARNIISGSGGDGISIFGQGGVAARNKIQGNYIGTDLTGANPLGNLLCGVHFFGDTQHNIVGGIGAGEGNIVAYNGYITGNYPGILIEDAGSVGNAVSSNSIHSNGYYGSLGIDLGDDGVSPNDAGDGDAGPNNLQNYPVLTSFTSAGGNTHVMGTLNSTPNSLFALEFYANSSPDPTGYGEGETYLGLAVATTDAGGDVTFDESFPIAVPTSHGVSATATAVDSSTSEFSQVAYYAVLTLTAHLTAGNVVLGWNDIPGAAEYWVYGAGNDAYFEPGISSPYQHRVAIVPAPATSWSSNSGVGDPSSNWAYLVVAVDASELELVRSERVGEFDFSVQSLD